MITVTLNAIRVHGPCESGWRKLLAHLGKTKGDDAPLSLLTILESNGLDDAIWCLRALDGYDKEIRLFAVWCARQVAHLSPDPRVTTTLDVAERFANGEATQEELQSAYAAAYAAAAYAAAYAAAAYAAAAANAATNAAANAATNAAAAAANAATNAAANAATNAAQSEKFKEIFA